MGRLQPVLDHLVIDVRDRMDDAVATYRALGFCMTERGYHTLGSMNHLAIFGTDYLELLGYPPGQNARPELTAHPPGLNGLVFKTADAAAVASALHDAGYACEPARAFSRPVTIDGGQTDARFRTAHLPPDAVPYGRVYWCEHQTPEVVWRPEWQQHPNGARSVSRVVIMTDDPQAAAAELARLFVPEALRAEPDGTVVVQAGTARLVFAPRAALDIDADALPDTPGRRAAMGAIVLKTEAIERTRRALIAGGIEHRAAADRIIVPARAAMQVALVFEI